MDENARRMALVHDDEVRRRVNIVEDIIIMVTADYFCEVEQGEE